MRHETPAVKNKVVCEKCITFWTVFLQVSYFLYNIFWCLLLTISKKNTHAIYHMIAKFLFFDTVYDTWFYFKDWLNKCKKARHTPYFLHAKIWFRNWSKHDWGGWLWKAVNFFARTFQGGIIQFLTLQHVLFPKIYISLCYWEGIAISKNRALLAMCLQHYYFLLPSPGRIGKSYMRTQGLPYNSYINSKPIPNRCLLSFCMNRVCQRGKLSSFSVLRCAAIRIKNLRHLQPFRT